MVVKEFADNFVTTSKVVSLDNLNMKIAHIGITKEEFISKCFESLSKELHKEYYLCFVGNFVQ